MEETPFTVAPRLLRYYKWFCRTSLKYSNNQQYDLAYLLKADSSKINPEIL